MKYILFLILMAFSFNTYALDCAEAPNCVDLGFTDENCPEGEFLSCPFDLSLKKCVGSQNVNCEALKFSKSDKSEWCVDIIKCPSDETYTLCNAGKATSTRCSVGDVFYANGTCFPVGEYSSTLGTPIGVVFMASEDGKSGKIVNLTEFAWVNSKPVKISSGDDSYSRYDIGWGLKNIDTGTTLFSSAENLKNALKNMDEAAYNGKEATKRLSEITKSDCSYNTGTRNYEGSCLSAPAQAAVEFYPDASVSSNADYGKGAWWLPAVGELAMIHGLDPAGVTSGHSSKGATGDTIELVNYTLQQLFDKGIKAAPIEPSPYWSSTQYSLSSAYMVSMYDGKRSTSAKDNAWRVRFITDFNF